LICLFYQIGARGNPGMLGPHGGNMVPQAANQPQFMQQFSAGANPMNVTTGQPNTQAAVPQQPQNLPLNALGSLGSQMNCPAPPQAPLGATPPPSVSAPGTGANLPPLQTNQAGTPTPGPAQSTPPHSQPQTELPALPQPHPGTPSGDNRVPTPASTASTDLHAHAVPELPPAAEPKAEPKLEEQDFESSAVKAEPKME
ncbi:CREB-binding protein isoform X2, partial [Silurus meridionalis]